MLLMRSCVLTATYGEEQKSACGTCRTKKCGCGNSVATTSAPKSQRWASVQPRKPTKQIGFDEECYKQHGMFLPTPFAPLLESIAESIAISQTWKSSKREDSASLRKVLAGRRLDLF